MGTFYFADIFFAERECSVNYSCDRMAQCFCVLILEKPHLEGKIYFSAINCHQDFFHIPFRVNDPRESRVRPLTSRIFCTKPKFPVGPKAPPDVFGDKLVSSPNETCSPASCRLLFLRIPSVVGIVRKRHARDLHERLFLGFGRVFRNSAEAPAMVDIPKSGCYNLLRRQTSSAGTTTAFQRRILANAAIIVAAATGLVGRPFR